MASNATTQMDGIGPAGESGDRFLRGHGFNPATVSAIGGKLIASFKDEAEAKRAADFLRQYPDQVSDVEGPKPLPVSGEFAVAAKLMSRTPGDAPVAMAIEFRPAGKGIGGGDLTHAIKNGEVVATIKSGIGGLYYVAPERPGASMGSFKVCHSEGEAKDYVAQTFSRSSVNLHALSRALSTGHFERSPVKMGGGWTVGDFVWFRTPSGWTQGRVVGSGEWTDTYRVELQSGEVVTASDLRGSKPV